MSGLRERKKRATENAIERTAVHLALEKGFGQVTVPEICEGADISRSTFFNYMPNREAAIFGRPLHMVPFDRAWAVMEEKAADSLLRALYDVALASVGASRVNAEVAAGRTRLGREQPTCVALLLAPFTSLSTDLAGLTYLWLESDPSRRRLPEQDSLHEAILTVSVIGTALQAAMAAVEDETDGDDADLLHDTFIDLVEQIRTVATHLDSPAGATKP